MNYSRNNYTNSTNGGDKGNLGNQGAGALYAATTYPSYLPVKDENGIARKTVLFRTITVE